MGMSSLPSCMYVHYVCACHPQRLKEDTGFLRTGITDGCDLSHGCWEIDLDPLQEQHVYLTTNLSLHSQKSLNTMGSKTTVSVNWFSGMHHIFDNFNTIDTFSPGDLDLHEGAFFPVRLLRPTNPIIFKNHKIVDNFSFPLSIFTRLASKNQ